MTTPPDAREPQPPEFKRTPLPERLSNLGRLLDTMEQRGMDGVVDGPAVGGVAWAAAVLGPRGLSRPVSSG